MPTKNSPKAIGDHLTNMITAWEKQAPAASFGGMTLAQFKTKVQPSFDSRAKIEGLDAQMASAINERDDNDDASSTAADLVVKGIVGDVNFGADSSLYEALGYVRSSERKTGLTRKTAAADAAAKAVK